MDLLISGCWPPPKRDSHTHPMKQSHHKKSNLHLLRPLLDPISNLQEMRKTEEHVKQYHGDAVSKILTMGNSTGQKTEFLQQIKYKGEETQGRGTRGLRVVKGMSTSCNIQT